MKRTSFYMWVPLIGTFFLLLALAACTQTDEPAPDAAPSSGMEVPPPDSTSILDVVEQFHRALAVGDSAVVANLLAADAIILESGGVETREEYLSHHFHSDAAFLGATLREPATSQLSLANDAAWMASTSRIHGTFRDRAVDLNSAELILLRRLPEGWRITAIHWSSRSR